MIIAFVLLGKLMEERAKNSTSSAIKGLMGLQPKTARLVTDGREEEVPISNLQVGNVVSVRPGEKDSSGRDAFTGELFGGRKYAKRRADSGGEKCR